MAPWPLLRGVPSDVHCNKWCASFGHLTNLSLTCCLLRTLSRFWKPLSNRNLSCPCLLNYPLDRQYSHCTVFCNECIATEILGWFKVKPLKPFHQAEAKNLISSILTRCVPSFIVIGYVMYQLSCRGYMAAVSINYIVKVWQILSAMNMMELKSWSCWWKTSAYHNIS